MNGQQAGKFFVTGLPRSRTAWMAAFLSTGESLCLHEPSYRMRSIEDLVPMLDSRFYRHIGVSESGLGFFTKWIIDHLQARVLVIERDIGEVEQALKKLGFPSNFPYCTMLLEALLEVRDHPMVKWVHFNALQHKRVMQDIYWWLLPGMAFDEVRWQQFENFRIEIDMQRGLERYVKHQDNMTTLFADVNARLRELANAKAA
jgi:hypothetical protein